MIPYTERNGGSSADTENLGDCCFGTLWEWNQLDWLRYIPWGVASGHEVWYMGD